jgi:phosphotransferase system  glucose/maltose/N-acetylglucosamine-specific IIC component
MMNMTTDPSDQGDYPLLQTIVTVLGQYFGFIPVAFGVPGNILAMIVANRKHNRNVAPCIYMAAMAVADTIFLLEMLWFFTLVTPGRLYGLTNLYQRGILQR